MGNKQSFGSIAPALRRWVRDPGGVAHAVRQSDGDHHSVFCRKYVRGRAFKVYAGDRDQARCPDCLHHLEHPLVLYRDLTGEEMRTTRRCVVQGRGVLAELRNARNRKGKGHN